MRRGTRRVSHRGLPSTAGVSAPSDRRFRRRDLGSGRHRRVAPVTRWMIRTLAPVAGVTVLVVWLGVGVLDSRLLVVDRVVVRGNAHLAASEVAALVDGIRGEHILLVDFDHYRRQVLAAPWVAHATLWRVLPSTIELRVSEREPIALARMGPDLYLVDAAGVVIDVYGPRYRDVDLPIVDGLVSEIDGRPVADPERLGVAVRALSSISDAPDLRDRVSQLDLANPHNVLALIDGDPAWLYLGDTAFVERLRTYLEISAQMHERFQFDHFDLRFDRRYTLADRGNAGRPPE